MRRVQHFQILVARSLLYGELPREIVGIHSKVLVPTIWLGIYRNLRHITSMRPFSLVRVWSPNRSAKKSAHAFHSSAATTKRQRLTFIPIFTVF
jgi:hypothetical protein